MSLNILKSLSMSDTILERIILEIPKPEIESTGNVFHDLLSCVIEQQIHYRSTKKIFQKMLNAANLVNLAPDNFVSFEEKAFGNSKVSMSKYETINGILEFWQTNQIDWKSISDDKVVSLLSSIKGIGKWTIDMILLYTLQRPNVFPYDDFHLKQIMVNLYGLNRETKLKAQMLEVAHYWGENKSLAVLYLLAWKDFNKKQIGIRLN